MRFAKDHVRVLPSHLHRERNSKHTKVLSNASSIHLSIYLIVIRDEEINVVTHISGGRGKTVFQEDRKPDMF